MDKMLLRVGASDTCACPKVLLALSDHGDFSISTGSIIAHFYGLAKNGLLKDAGEIGV